VELHTRIKNVRTLNKLSLRGLADKCGVSPSMVSQIENGKVDPSLSTLRKIAIALDVPLFYLVLEGGETTGSLVKKNERRHIYFKESGLAYEIIHSEQTKKIGVMIGTLEPGGATSENPLAHKGEECVIVLDGTLQVETLLESFDLEQGDSYYFDSSIPHRLLNPGTTPCHFNLTITPPKF
jgi:transcriptional regulator with XRE-family HTH domain